MALTDVFEQHLAGTRHTACVSRRMEVVLSFLGIWRQASNVAALIRTRGSAEYSVAALFFWQEYQGGWRVYKKAVHSGRAGGK